MADEDGNDYHYTVEEVDVPDVYRVGYDYDYENNSVIVTNSYTPETKTINVKKVWNDDNNRDRVRPEFVRVQLYNGHEKVDRPGFLEDANHWQWTYENLPKYEDGVEIEYSLIELDVPEAIPTTSIISRMETL